MALSDIRLDDIYRYENVGNFAEWSYPGGGFIIVPIKRLVVLESRQHSFILYISLTRKSLVIGKLWFRSIN